MSHFHERTYPVCAICIYRVETLFSTGYEITKTWSVHTVIPSSYADIKSRAWVYIKIATPILWTYILKLSFHVDYFLYMFVLDWLLFCFYGTAALGFICLWIVVFWFFCVYVFVFSKLNILNPGILKENRICFYKSKPPKFFATMLQTQKLSMLLPTWKDLLWQW